MNWPNLIASDNMWILSDWSSSSWYNPETYPLHNSKSEFRACPMSPPCLSVSTARLFFSILMKTTFILSKQNSSSRFFCPSQSSEVGVSRAGTGGAVMWSAVTEREGRHGWLTSEGWKPDKLSQETADLAQTITGEKQRKCFFLIKKIRNHISCEMWHLPGRDRLLILRTLWVES